MKKPIKKAIKVNKLLQHFGGKLVTVTLKESALLGGSPVVKNILLDADENFYYLGDYNGKKTEINFAIPVHTVMMIADGDLNFTPQEDEKKPFGDKYQ